MAIVQPQKQGSSGIGKIMGIAKAVGGAMTGNPLAIAEGIGSLAPADSGAAKLGGMAGAAENIGAMGRRLMSPDAGGAGAGLDPGVRGGPMQRRMGFI